MKYNSPNVSPLFSVGNKIFLLLIALLSLIGNGYAQNPAVNVFEDWNTTSGTQNNFQRSIVRSKGIGGATYYYLCGSTINSSGNYDFLVQKKNASGVVLWSQTYNGSGNGNDYAADVQIDAVGNVYICGTYYKNSTDSNNAVLIKYNNAGTHQWTQVFNGAGSGHDALAAIQLTSDGILVAGTTWQNSTDMYDMLVMRYDTTGSLIWSQNWDYNDLNDIAVNLYSSRSRIYVAGGVQSAATTYKYGMFTVLYSDGSYQGSMTAGGTAFGFDQLTAIQYDDSGYVYLTGGVLNLSTGYDIKTIKLDTLLNTMWSVTYSSAGAYNDVGTALALDTAGNIFVTGYKTSATSGKDYVTIKYSSGGTQRWVSTFDGGINADDSATAIVVNSADTNKIYVTGFSYNGSTKDYWTLKYDGAGNLKWNIGFNNTANTDDRATSIALDTLGNIIVAGQNKLAWNSHTYTTVKYVEKSTTLPQDTVSSTSTSLTFLENKGQLLGRDTLPHPEIKFYTLHGSPNVYFSDTSLSYVFVKADASASPQDSSFRVDMKFVGANSDMQIRAMDQRNEMNNFYYSHIPGGRERVMEYDQLVSFNVWNNVDVVYGSNLRGLKYYFICKPTGGGGSSYQIDLKYEGADSVKIGASGELIIYTRFGNIVQPKAAAWQLDASGNYSSLGWQPSYQIVGTNEVKFTGLGSYNSAYPLIIAVDRGNVFPVSILNLEWSTYFGGDYREIIYDVDVSQSNGNSYYTGWSWSTDFPTTIGAYQPTNSGGQDAVAVRIDSIGQRVYSTYYGTNSATPSIQMGYAGAVASSGNYFIGGHTNRIASETIAFPTSQPPGAYVDNTYAGSGIGAFDAFIAGFNPSGNLIWATYYGGAGNALDEAIKDMAFDNNGNLYAVMNADTLTPQLVESGAYNDSTIRGGMILKFDQSLARTWATMFSTKNGATTRIVFDGAGNFYVTGRANDTLLPVVDPGGGAYFDTTLSGTSDAFIAKFNSSDSLIWSTYFGGSGTEIGTAIEVFSGEVYIAGTTSSSNLPYYYPGSSYIDSTLSGTNDIFISHFKTNGQRLWTTYYGGSSTEGIANMATDLLGNIYLVGSSVSSDFSFKNAPFIYGDSVFGGGTTADVILISFDSQNQRKWASYFGGLDADDGLGIDIYQNSRMYICGQTGTKSTFNPNFPTQNLSGAYWQPTMGGTNEAAFYNGFMSRFSLAPFINVGISEPNIYVNNSSLFVYPNPSEGQFQVLINSDSKNRKIEVYNSIGQIVQSIDIADGLRSQEISINLGEQATGVYFVVLKDDNGICSRKIVKQ